MTETVRLQAKGIYRLADGLGVLLIVLLALGSIAGCDKPAPTKNSDTANGFVGVTTCLDCHAEQTGRWRTSHHALAMQTATPETVLGDFADSSFVHNGVRTRFFTKDGEFYVETDGKDGDLSVFPVRYTFGVTPLQQYLLELPDGKLQALSIAWDSRPTAAGGQRWFHVYGDEPIDYTDVLHWTRYSQNWETMCADCHSTNLLSQYQFERDRFTTTWEELNVSCEACHGAGASHVTWARDNPGTPMPANGGFDVAFSERRNIVWQLNSATGNSKRSSPRTTEIEINACAGCHSRRARIADSNDPAQPYLDNYMPALIDPPLYHADGQMRDEVYVYGSFLQSKMHQAGVTCSDCHDPHTLQLRAPGPAVCLQCHAAEKFKTVTHQMHPAETTNCLDCHMPSTTYMQNDARRDHSLRIPRPELSVTYDVPNACNTCHADKDANWAVQALQAAGRINSGAALQHWSGRLAAATAGMADPQSAEILMQLTVDESVPAIIRGTAAGRLVLGDSPANRVILAKLARAPEGLVRLGAATALQNSDPALAATFGPALLDDPLRAVRVSAVQALAGLDPAVLPVGSNPAMQRVLAEYIASQEINSERPESHVNLGNLRRAQGRFELAEPAFREAMKLNPDFIPAYANLADLYREWQREEDAEAVLREGLARLPNDAFLRYSLGLALIRQNRLRDALPELEMAAESADASPRFALVYALALNEASRTKEAVAYIEAARQRFGDQPELIDALTKLQSLNP
jgi:predicted CXXCH cytochrome family protein